MLKKYYHHAKFYSRRIRYTQRSAGLREYDCAVFIPITTRTKHKSIKCSIIIGKPPLKREMMLHLQLRTLMGLFLIPVLLLLLLFCFVFSFIKF